MMQKKVYDYDERRVRSVLVDGFRKRGREATVADLVAQTALPKVQVEEQLPAVADEFSARLRVTESGEVLYSFPRGMRSRYRGAGPALRKFLSAAGKVLAATLTFAFKAWIALTLVGYFVFFLALLVVFLVGGVAAQSGGNRSSSRRDSGGNIIGAILNLFIRIWFYSEFFKATDSRRYRADRGERGDRRPLHKAVFSFVFGDGDPNAQWPQIERKAVLAYLRSHAGLISLEEFMILTGRDYEDASIAINAYCVEFEGSPEASPEGVVYYQFESIMRSVDSVQSAADSAPAKRAEAFSSNPAKANACFAAMNGVNFIFGGFFLTAAATWGESALRALEAGSRALRGDFLQSFYAFVLAVFSIAFPNPVQAVSVFLGWVPLSFALLFYLVPALRFRLLKRRNRAIERENQRRVVYGQAWASPDALSPGSASASPDGAKDRARLLDELATHTESAIEADPSGGLRYSFPEFKRAKQAMDALRRGAKPGGSSVGKAIFDTDARADE
jgi:hypothetical protein